MNIPYLHSSHALTAVLFFIALTPFIVIRLCGALTAVSSSGPGKSHKAPRLQVAGLALCVMITVPPLTAASAEEVFVIFTESGPELYQVDTVREPSLTQGEYRHAWWEKAAPKLTLNRSSFAISTVRKDLASLSSGFKNTASDVFGRNTVGIEWPFSQTQGDVVKQVVNPLHQENDPVPVQSQQIVQRKNLQSFPILPN